MMRPRIVGCPTTVPDADCRPTRTANPSDPEEKCMPVPKVEPVLPILEETPPPESGLLGAMLIVWR